MAAMLHADRIEDIQAKADRLVAAGGGIDNVSESDEDALLVMMEEESKGGEGRSHTRFYSQSEAECNESQAWYSQEGEEEEGEG